MDFLVQIDTAAFFSINQGLANPVFDVLMPFITRIKNMALLAILAVGFLAIKGGKKGRVALAVILVSIALADLISHEAIKPWVGRFRPSDPRAGLEGVRALLGAKTSFSFPSNHAANITALATCVSFYYRKLLWPMVALAVTIAFSRVYVGVHYPADVLAGAILGASIASGILFAAGKIKFLRIEFPPKDPT